MKPLQKGAQERLCACLSFWKCIPSKCAAQIKHIRVIADVNMTFLLSEEIWIRKYLLCQHRPSWAHVPGRGGISHLFSDLSWSISCGLSTFSVTLTHEPFWIRSRSAELCSWACRVLIVISREKYLNPSLNTNSSFSLYTRNCEVQTPNLLPMRSLTETQTLWREQCTIFMLNETLSNQDMIFNLNWASRKARINFWFKKFAMTFFNDLLRLSRGFLKTAHTAWILLKVLLFWRWHGFYSYSMYGCIVWFITRDGLDIVHTYGRFFIDNKSFVCEIIDNDQSNFVCYTFYMKSKDPLFKKWKSKSRSSVYTYA